MEYVFRLLIFLRLFLRLFAFTYPLLLTVMYNFWIFERLSMTLWVGYVVIMAVLELVLGLLVDKRFSRVLLKAYVILALCLEFPSLLLEVDFHTTIAFLLWVLPWYGSIVLLGVLVVI